MYGSNGEALQLYAVVITDTVYMCNRYPSPYPLFNRKQMGKHNVKWLIVRHTHTHTLLVTKAMQSLIGCLWGC